MLRIFVIWLKVSLFVRVFNWIHQLYNSLLIQRTYIYHQVTGRDYSIDPFKRRYRICRYCSFTRRFINSVIINRCLSIVVAGFHLRFNSTHTIFRNCTPIHVSCAHTTNCTDRYLVRPDVFCLFAQRQTILPCKWHTTVQTVVCLEIFTLLCLKVCTSTKRNLSFNYLLLINPIRCSCFLCLVFLL